MSARSPKHCGSRLLRRIQAVLTLALLLGVLGHGHALETLGVAACPCEAPVESTTVAADHAEGAQTRLPDRCPPDCPRCPCGQIPTAPVTIVAMLEPVLEFIELPSWPPELPTGHSVVDRLDRPPRTS